ncbi:hypothetical protein VP1G_07780 [Cytospora mali]|uniref:Uncharacterized protein n=1 Tax=Cytospora mali TaxID=578113 RepID=A0A194V9G1_CYTMA|nr:hypothetical protein VP1G_07780 [Valsa mali var. pyri (nom. inval.)]
MAATPFAPSFHPSFSPFDIFRDGGAPRNTPPPASPSLPGGPCNFVDLSHGPNGPKCGCRRFWSCQVSGLGNRTTDQMGWCMCSHHACYHDDAQNVQNPQNAQDTQAIPAPLAEDVPGQENEKPRSNRMPLSPVQDLASFHMPSGLGGASMDFAALNFHSFSSNLDLGANPPQYQPSQPFPPGLAPDTDSLPDTMSWRNVNSTQGGQTPLPPIPSPCLMPLSQSASTTASSQLRYLRPFGGKGMNTLSGVSRARASTQKELASTTTGVDTAPSSRDECHTGDGAITVPSGAVTPTPGPSRLGGTPRPASVLSVGQSNGGLQDITDTVQDHEQRLETLESGSIYNTALEEFSEKHDMTDLRLTEIENRMDDVERKLNDDNTSVFSSNAVTRCRNDATGNEMSVSYSAIERALDHAALARLFEPLQARVTQLESSSLPSYTSPWELEVVFLPFPLKGIWIEEQNFKIHPGSGGRYENTQWPNSNSRATPMPQALAAYDEWAGLGSGWLLPKACAPGRMIDQRLRSRGFSKTVQVRGCGARSVQLAISNAFESILRVIPHPDSPRSPYAADPRLDKYLGLQQSWLPLRKVHKDARLRFLSPTELLTPTNWDATFLMDSVVMKATGMHRLYITQPEAYLQDNQTIRFHSVNSGWAWQKLRELDRVYPDSQVSDVSSEVPEADALEEYWAFDARYDDPPNSRQSSVSLHQPHKEFVNISRTTDGSSQPYYSLPPESAASMASPVMARGQSPFTPSERRGSRPPDVRIGSVPPFRSPDTSSPVRVVHSVPAFAPNNPSLGQGFQRHPSPLATGRSTPRVSVVSNKPALSMVIKKRDTRSPSFRPYGTPRYTNKSYSRSPSIPPFAHQQYMTPHSIAPAVHSPEQRSNSHSVQVDQNDDEAMESDNDRGSLTGSSNGEGDSDMADDDDPDNSEYEERTDHLDDLESEAWRRSSQPQGPEDIPRQGIEDNLADGENVDPSGFDSDDDDADNSDASLPSQYSIRKQPLTAKFSGMEEVREGTRALDDDDDDADDDELERHNFTIHEDDEPEAQTEF